MSLIFWVIPALLSTIGAAVITLVNEYMKVRALHLLFWMRLLTVLILLPGIFFVDWQENWPFFILMMLNALTVAYSDVVRIGLTAKSGAGIMSRLEPLVNGLIFILWLLFSPSLVMDYASQPLRTLGIILSIIAGIYFALRLKKCPLSLEALKISLPALFLAAMAIVIGRIALDCSAGGGAVYKYVFVQSLFIFLIYLSFHSSTLLSRYIPHLELDSEIFDRRVLLAGAIAALAWVSAVPLKWFAILQVENPAYVTIFGLTVPLWVLLVYRVVGRKEQADVVSGMGIVASAAALVYFTSF